MTKTGFAALFLGAIYSFLIGFLCYSLGAMKVREEYSETPSVLAQSVISSPKMSNLPTPTPTAAPTGYLIKKYNSRIGVYQGEELVRIVDVAVATLRLSDQNRLEKGIEVADKEELAEALEDFGS